MSDRLLISIVIPVYNESGNIAPLYKDICSVLNDNEYQYEIIFVNDGSTDATQREIESLDESSKNTLRYIEIRTRYGKATSLSMGFHYSRGDIIVTLDGDMQDDPSFIPRFIEKIEEGYDLVSGWKQNRKDNYTKRYTSRFFNFATALISPVKLHDYNSGFKAYRREAVANISLYGELHRYIPVIVAGQGYRVAEIPVAHRARKHGTTKYGPIRFIHGFLDLVTVLFITKFHSRPLHFFGYLGLVLSGIGSVSLLYLFILKFAFGEAIGDRPLLLLSIMLVIIGIQIGMSGLIAEQIAYVGRRDIEKHIIKKHT